MPHAHAIAGLAAVLAAAMLWPTPARSAQSYDNCTGTIEAFPAVISTQGTWCLKSNLTTSMTSGTAITIAGNNITLDCNDFKIGGLAAGVATNAVGIYAFERLNPTIRNCGIRGFRDAIWINGEVSFGALIEDNRFDNNTRTALYVSGGGHVIRRNRLVDTGGRPGASFTNAMQLFAEQSTVTDNVIAGVFNTSESGDVTGIAAFGNANEVARNYITGLVVDETGSPFGISTAGATGNAIQDNRVLNPVELASTGVAAGAGNFCGGNLVAGFAAAVSASCIDTGGNFGD